MLRHSISKGLIAICTGVFIVGCDQPAAPRSGHDPAGLRPLAAHNAGPPTAELFASGLDGGLGSTIGPDGALYAVESLSGEISRVDPKTGAITTFASGLPASLFPAPGNGGPMDIAFIGKTAYVLVSGVGSDLGGTDIVGIYRVDGPTSFTVIADIGQFALDNPPTGDFFVPTGFQYAMEPYHHGFIVTDGHHNRVLQVTLDGEVTEVIQFTDIVPTGLAMKGNKVYMAEAGPVPHLAENGKVVTFDAKKSPTVTEEASGAKLAVDVEFGHGNNLYVLSQGHFTPGQEPGSPADPNTGALMEVNKDGTLTVIVDGLNQPTSLEFIKNTAYVVTLGGEIWKIEDVPKKSH